MSSYVMYLHFCLMMVAPKGAGSRRLYCIIQAGRSFESRQGPFPFLNACFRWDLVRGNALAPRGALSTLLFVFAGGRSFMSCPRRSAARTASLQWIISNRLPSGPRDRYGVARNWKSGRHNPRWRSSWREEVQGSRKGLPGASPEDARRCGTRNPEAEVRNPELPRRTPEVSGPEVRDPKTPEVRGRTPEASRK